MTPVIDMAGFWSSLAKHTGLALHFCRTAAFIELIEIHGGIDLQRETSKQKLDLGWGNSCLDAAVRYPP